MASLIELAQIERESRTDLGEATGDVLLSAQLRAKVRMALIIAARALLNGETLTVAGNPWPPEGDGEARNNAIGWAQGVMRQPDPAADAAMRIALAGAEGITAAQIRGIGDPAIKTQLASLIPALAKGAHPGR